MRFSDRGFTTLEILLVASILGLILLSAVSVFLPSWTSTTRALQLESLDLPLRNVMEKLVVDLRYAKEVTPEVGTDESGYTKVTIRTDDGGIVAYTLADGNLQYEAGGTTSTIAKDVLTFLLTPVQSAKGWKVDIQSVASGSEAISTVVYRKMV